ncbi:acetamidase/formamidase family protein [Aestuariivirga sp.]|uniref:acetamidase/formamidase family protein n=1 Tax=Aestuariivirga sp. TaxID=2650926 RepID=UPI0039E45120
MTTHHFSPTRFFNTIGSHAPELTVADGDTVIAATLDAHGFDAQDERPARNPNPMSGPIFVKGAEPGDALSVLIEKIAMVRPTGWTMQGLAANVVDPKMVPHLPPREKVDWIIDTNSGSCRLKEPGAHQLPEIPIKPMIGCLGVAPSGGEAITTSSSGPYGGNMDYRRIAEGTEILFPVSAPGALFFLGDVHAAQGDGEIAGTGIETAAEVRVTLKVVKGKTLLWPRGFTAEDVFTIGNARPLDQALQHATSEMLRVLTDDYGMTAIAASHLMGQAVRYDVANVFNPAYSVACRIGKRWLNA